jgi:pyruvate,orthophosphate dikinase
MIGDRVLHEGELITIDGETGRIYSGRIPVTIERPQALLATVATWSEAAREGRRTGPRRNPRPSFIRSRSVCETTCK